VTRSSAAVVEKLAAKGYAAAASVEYAATESGW
jgi:hypothetical protein